MSDFSQIEDSIVEIRKRSGKVTSFNRGKISNAIYKALIATGKADRAIAEELADGVVKKLLEQGFSATHPPSVEDIQDMVESTLIDQDYSDIAKAYILYRHERRKIRDEKKRILNSKSLDLVAKKFDINYKILKIHNPWLRDTYLKNDSGKEYFIEIPESGHYN